MEAAGGTRQFGTVSLTGLGTGGADHLPQHRVHERCRSEHRRSGVRENESESESAIRVGMGGSESAHAHHRCGPTRGLQAGPARGHGLAVAGVAAGGGRPEAAACRLVAHPSTPPLPFRIRIFFPFMIVQIDQRGVWGLAGRRGSGWCSGVLVCVSQYT